jgi:hypothetical protein
VCGRGRTKYKFRPELSSEEEGAIPFSFLLITGNLLADPLLDAPFTVWWTEDDVATAERRIRKREPVTR